jgi:serine protease inhibitor
MRLSALILSLILLALSVLYCSEQPLHAQPPDSKSGPLISRTTAELTSQEIGVLTSSNKFGLNIFREITARTPATKNVFFSPLSASYALAMCYNGAEGDTREAIGSILELADLSLEEMNQAFYAATQILVQADPLVDFRAANSLWSRQGKAIQPDFISLAQTYYDARVEEVDFQSAQALDTINAWVDWATNGKITDMVKPPIDPDVAAMLFNAIYFKGNWMFPFDTANTRTGTFHLADGSDTQCQMMHLSQLDCLMQHPDHQFPETDTTSPITMTPKYLFWAYPTAEAISE